METITGVDQPRYADNASPGYNHEVYWKNIVKDGKCCRGSGRYGACQQGCFIKKKAALKASIFIFFN